MKIARKKRWQQLERVYQDPLGLEIMDSAKKWAEAMEACIARGVSVAECAERTLAKVAPKASASNVEFMVSVLRETWGHRRQMTAWHFWRARQPNPALAEAFRGAN